jgi:hypothetical protein
MDDIPSRRLKMEDTSMANSPGEGKNARSSKAFYAKKSSKYNLKDDSSSKWLNVCDAVCSHCCQ